LINALKKLTHCVNALKKINALTALVLSNEMVLIEQYANDRESGGQSPPEAKTHLAFVRPM